MPLTTRAIDDVILAADHNEIYNLLKGVAGNGEAITLVHNAAASLIFQPSSDPAAGTEVVQIKNNAGTVQGSLTFDGKVKVADGTAALPSMRFQSEATGLYLSSAGVIGVAVAGAAANILLQSGTISIGGTVSTSGTIRLANTGNIAARNAGDSANYNLIRTDSGDVIYVAADTIQVTQSTSAMVLTGPSVTLGGASGGKFIAAGTLTAGGLLGSAVQVATSGPLIYSGSGAPSISAAVKGSLYLRSDGTTTNDRIYVAKDTAGAWASLTAAS